MRPLTFENPYHPDFLYLDHEMIVESDSYSSPLINNILSKSKALGKYRGLEVILNSNETDTINLLEQLNFNPVLYCHEFLINASLVNTTTNSENIISFNQFDDLERVYNFMLKGYIRTHENWSPAGPALINDWPELCRSYNYNLDDSLLLLDGNTILACSSVIERDDMKIMAYQFAQSEINEEIYLNRLLKYQLHQLKGLVAFEVDHTHKGLFEQLDWLNPKIDSCIWARYRRLID